MRKQAYTFGKLHLEVDKMAGLRLADRASGNKLNLQSWDEDVVPELGGELLLDDELRSGLLLTREQIGEMFFPLDEITGTRTYARRTGKLGRPKTAAVIRLQTRDAIMFELVLCDGGEGYLSTIATFEGVDQVDVVFKFRKQVVRKRMFDVNLYEEKMAKIRSTVSAV